MLMGQDGAVCDGLKEDDLALDVSRLCVFHFDVPGAVPALLRADDIRMTFVERNAAAIAAGCGLVVALHFDSNPNSTMRGARTYSYPTNQLTERIAQNTGAEMPEEIRTNIHFRTSPIDWRRRAHHVLGSYTAPAILIECAVITNPDDRRLVRRHGFLGEIAQGVCRGLVGAPEILRISP